MGKNKLEKKIDKRILREILGDYDYKRRFFFKYSAVKAAEGWRVRIRYSWLGYVSLLVSIPVSAVVLVVEELAPEIAREFKYERVYRNNKLDELL